MCNLSDGVEYRGILKGRAEGAERKQKQIAKLMKSYASKKGMSLQEFLKDMDVPQEEWELYARLAKES